jgi:hypothetical protein
MTTVHRGGVSIMGDSVHTDAGKVDPEFELDKLRFDYGWKWFSFHADQRTKMFNFFILAAGILATAVFSWYHQKTVACLLCATGVLVSVIFSRLDRRNQTLVMMGEEILGDLERRRLFGEHATFKLRDNQVRPFGILWRQAQEDVQAPPSFLKSARAGKHRVWLPGIAYLAAALFCAAGVGFYFSPDVPPVADRAASGLLAKPPCPAPALPLENPNSEKESKPANQ